MVVKWTMFLLPHLSIQNQCILDESKLNSVQFTPIGNSFSMFSSFWHDHQPVAEVQPAQTSIHCSTNWAKQNCRYSLSQTTFHRLCYIRSVVWSPAGSDVRSHVMDHVTYAIKSVGMPLIVLRYIISRKLLKFIISSLK